MNVAVVAIGQGGGKIADALLRYQADRDIEFVTSAIAVNTARADLLGLREIPLEKRVLIGESRVKGHGAGADNELGAEIADEDTTDVMDAVDEIPTTDVDAFLVVAALGGGTGSGGAPVFTRELKRRYEEPVFGLGVLPSRDEGGIYTLNAARSFQTFVREADSVILFDNDVWRQSAESLAGGFQTINEEIAKRLGVLFSAGEATNPTPEKVVDASEIINTMRGGGVTTIGYATAALDPVPRGLFGGRKARSVDSLAASNRISSTVRRATLGRLTVQADVTSTERGLLVVAGPPDQLSRGGIDDARAWLEDTTGCREIRSGDYPVPDSDYVAGLVVLSGVTEIPRVDELKQVGVETQRRMKEIEERAPEALSELLWTGNGEIKPLF